MGLNRPRQGYGGVVLGIADSEDEWPSSQTLFPKEQSFKVGFPRPLGGGEGIQSVHTQLKQCLVWVGLSVKNCCLIHCHLSPRHLIHREPSHRELSYREPNI
jgi:hypothetical protein